jgi:hypothetical protein
VRKPFVALLLFVSLTAALTPETSVVISGTAKSCFQDREISVPGIEVSAFSPTSSHTLDSLLRWLDSVDVINANDATASQYDASYWQLVGFLRDSSRLARDTTDAGGNFALTVPSADSVIVIGHAESEDQPYYYAWKKLGAMSSSSFILDMSAGTCP